jgi:hypothetical protein
MPLLNYVAAMRRRSGSAICRVCQCDHSYPYSGRIRLSCFLVYEFRRANYADCWWRGHSVHSIRSFVTGWSNRPSRPDGLGKSSKYEWIGSGVAGDLHVVRGHGHLRFPAVCWINVCERPNRFRGPIRRLGFDDAGARLADHSRSEFRRFSSRRHQHAGDIREHGRPRPSAGTRYQHVASGTRTLHLGDAADRVRGDRVCGPKADASCLAKRSEKRFAVFIDNSPRQ